VAWQTPKTNWTPADAVGQDDFNRIEANHIALINLLESHYDSGGLSVYMNSGGVISGRKDASEFVLNSNGWLGKSGEFIKTASHYTTLKIVYTFSKTSNTNNFKVWCYVYDDYYSPIENQDLDCTTTPQTITISADLTDVPVGHYVKWFLRLYKSSGTTFDNMHASVSDIKIYLE
jgi:hypothetical protein